MSKRVNVKTASELTGLTEYELRRGAKAGKYPHILIGHDGQRRKILFDMALLEKCLTDQALSMVQHYEKKQEGFF